MASRNYICPAPSLIINDNPRNPTVHDSLFEFDESEIWNSTCPNPAPPLEAATATATKKWIPISREPIKKMGMMRKMISSTKTTPASSSLPVNVPDWSKILKDDYKARDVGDDGGDDFSDSGGDDDHHGGGGGGDWIPPHEYLARTRGASLSVHEGVGRTLKGRDLRRVRNAIWKKVGFED